jgi:hypothetical protein
VDDLLGGMGRQPELLAAALSDAEAFFARHRS